MILSRACFDLPGRRPVVVLTGARQTGKTSTFRWLFPDHEFVSLDLPQKPNKRKRSRRAFSHPAPVIIDEVQSAPGLFRNLKVSRGIRASCSGFFQEDLNHEF